MNSDAIVSNAISVLGDRGRDEIFDTHFSKTSEDSFSLKFVYSNLNEKKRIMKTVKYLKKIFAKYLSDKSKIKILKINSEISKNKGLVSIYGKDMYYDFFFKKNIDLLKDVIFYKLY